MAGRLRQRMSSRESGDERLGYLQGSLQTLLNALLGALEKKGVTLVPNAKVLELVTESGALTKVRSTEGEFAADRFLATIPTTILAGLVRPLNESYADQLARIEYFGAVCTVLALDRPLSQTYWLNVADPGFPFGGVIEHTNLIPPEVYGGRHLVYLSRYFESGNALAQQTTEEIIQTMTSPLGRIYPGFSKAWIQEAWAFRSMTAATVCDLNFSQKVPSTITPIFGLHLAGMVHVYPDERSTNNSIRIAAEACRNLGIQTGDIPRGINLAARLGMN
jgi:protoporphyrinogen oxidase